jgi:nucleotide-binding universal stress UspA family protein
MKNSQILVAIDGSEPSMDAADCAISMTKLYPHAKLVALHVTFSDYEFAAYGSIPISMYSLT